MIFESSRSAAAEAVIASESVVSFFSFKNFFFFLLLMKEEEEGLMCGRAGERDCCLLLGLEEYLICEHLLLETVLRSLAFLALNLL